MTVSGLRMPALDAADVARFQEQGYLVVRGVLDEADFVPVRREYDELLRERVRTWRAKGLFSGGEDHGGLPFQEHLRRLVELPGFPLTLLAELDITLPHMPFSFIQEDSEFHVGPGVLSLLQNPKVLDVVECLLGSEINASPNQHCRIKLPAREVQQFGGRKGETIYAPTLWHQDAMGQLPQSNETTVLTVWIPTTDVDEENGCLAVVGGAHDDDALLPWPMDAALIDRLERKSIPLPVKFGDIVLLHKKAPHGSRLNKTAQVRWSFDFRYYPAHQPTDRPWFPNIRVRSKADPGSAVVDAGAWRKSWEDARAMLAGQKLPLPGRREFAQVVADGMIRRWEAGEYPSFPVKDVAAASTSAA